MYVYRHAKNYLCYFSKFKCQIIFSHNCLKGGHLRNFQLGYGSHGVHCEEFASSGGQMWLSAASGAAVREHVATRRRSRRLHHAQRDSHGQTVQTATG